MILIFGVYPQDSFLYVLGSIVLWGIVSKLKLEYLFLKFVHNLHILTIKLHGFNFHNYLSI